MTGRAPGGRRALLAWLAVGAASAAFGRACEGGCCCDPTSYIDIESDETSGPVRARIVIERGWRSTGGKIPGLRATRAPLLIVEGSPRVRLPLLRCRTDDPELVADAEGRRLAYRCDGKRWSIVYLRAHRAFEHCSVDAGAGDEIEWSRVPTWDATALALLGCVGDIATRPGRRAPDRPGPVELFAAEREAGGEAALARLLVGARDVLLTPWSCGCDAWIDAARGLSAAARAPVLEALRGATLDVGAPAARLWRALVLRGIEGPEASLRRQAERLAGEVGSAAVERGASGRPTRRTLEQRLTTHQQGYAQAVVSVLLRRLATRWGARAGELACAALERMSDQHGGGYGLTASDNRRHLALVVGVTRVRCPAVADGLRCGPVLECHPTTGAAAEGSSPDSVPCRREQLAAELATAIASDPLRAVWSSDAPPGRPHASIDEAARQEDRYAYAAAVLGDAVPSELALKLARRHYRLEPAGGPECSTLPATAVGRPCRCAYPGLRDLACVSPPERTSFERPPFCVLELDDAAGVAHQRRAACLSFAQCERDDQCCEGYLCGSFVDGGPRFCRRPPDAGASATDDGARADGG